jgi:hypothetical protein
MSLHSQVKMKWLATFGWGIGWGISWAIIAGYQESVSFGFLTHDSVFYLTWFIILISTFVLGWIMAASSTTGVLFLSKPTVRRRQLMWVPIGWGIGALVSGIAILGLGAIIGSILIRGESTFLLFYFCGLPVIILLGLALGGFASGRITEWALTLTLSLMSNEKTITHEQTWAVGPSLGLIVGLLVREMVLWPLDMGFLGSTIPQARIPQATIGGAAGGFVGGLIAGLVVNAAIWRFLQAKEQEKSKVAA